MFLIEIMKKNNFPAIEEIIHFFENNGMVLERYQPDRDKLIENYERFIKSKILKDVQDKYRQDEYRRKFILYSDFSLTIYKSDCSILLVIQAYKKQGAILFINSEVQFKSNTKPFFAGAYITNNHNCWQNAANFETLTNFTSDLFITSEKEIFHIVSRQDLRSMWQKKVKDKTISKILYFFISRIINQHLLIDFTERSFFNKLVRNSNKTLFQSFCTILKYRRIPFLIEKLNKYFYLYVDTGIHNLVAKQVNYTESVESIDMYFDNIDNQAEHYSEASLAVFKNYQIKMDNYLQKFATGKELDFFRDIQQANNPITITPLQTYHLHFLRKFSKKWRGVFYSIDSFNLIDFLNLIAPFKNEQLPKTDLEFISLVYFIFDFKKPVNLRLYARKHLYPIIRKHKQERKNITEHQLNIAAAKSASDYVFDYLRWINIVLQYADNSPYRMNHIIIVDVRRTVTPFHKLYAESVIWHNRLNDIERILSDIELKYKKRQDEGNTLPDIYSYSAPELLPDFSVENANIRQLCNEVALKLEGVAMGHCVGGYDYYVLTGRSIIFSINSDNGLRSTLEIQYDKKNKRFFINQHYGVQNTHISNSSINYKVAQKLLSEMMRRYAKNWEKERYQLFANVLPPKYYEEKKIRYDYRDLNLVTHIIHGLDTFEHLINQSN